MNLREQCIEAGRDAMGRNDGWRWWAPRHLARLFDLWEPMIRADERESIAARGTAAALKTMRREVEAETRAQIAADIEALAAYLVDDQSEPGGPSIIHRTVSLESALDIARGDA